MQYHQQQQMSNKKQIKIIPNSMKLIDKGKQISLQSSFSQNSSLQISQLQQKRLMTDQSQSQISNRQILLQQLQNNISCLFCNKCQKETQFSQMISTALYSKYSASQNYYFTKDINDILASQRTSAVIRLKDVQTYDEQEEFLNRLYLFHEYDNKIKRLTEYYKFHSDIARLFMQPITNTLNKYHDKKRRLYYIQITRMLKEKENQGKKDEKENKDFENEEKKERQNELKKNVNKKKSTDDNGIKDEKDFNIDDKSNGADQQKSFDMNGRFLAPLDDLDDQTKLVQSNTLQDLNNKLNDILMNSTRSMQSYLFDQDVSQSIGNLSDFLNHLKVSNNPQQISIPQKNSDKNNPNIGRDVNTLINFDPKEFQNILLNSDQKNVQPTILKNQFSLPNQQQSQYDTQNSQKLISNSQNIQQFLKKDSFLKKPQNGLQESVKQNINQKSNVPISSGNNIETENNIIKQILKNNSPFSNQKITQELQKQIQSSKTDRDHNNQNNDEQSQSQIQNLNQDMIKINQQKIQSGLQSAYSSIGNKEGLQYEDQQKNLALNSNLISKQNIIQSGNQIQLTQFDGKHISHLKTQSLNQGGFIYQDDKGSNKKTSSPQQNQGIQNMKTSEKKNNQQQIKDSKNYNYPINGMAETTSGKQSQNQSVERKSLNSLQQSINGLIKQAVKGIGSSTSSAEQSSIGLQSKLVSNTSSKYSSLQNKQDSKQQYQQQINYSQISAQQKQTDLIINKKINNLVQSEHQTSKKQQVGGSQTPLPTNSIVQQIILKQQSQLLKQQANQDNIYQDKLYNENQKQKPQIQQSNEQNQQEKQKSLSQQLSQQFQQQFSQQIQNYQRSLIQELQQYNAVQKQTSHGKNENKYEADQYFAPHTDRSQYNKKNNNQNQGQQKILSARDKEQNQKRLNDLNAQKLKTQEAIYYHRDNQFDVQRSNTRNNTDNYLTNNQNDEQIINPSQIQISQPQNLKQQNESKNIQQNQNIQHIIQGNVVKNSYENMKSYNNLVNFGQNIQHVPTHIRTQTLESYRESNLNSQENTQSNTQSQQASRNQSKNKNQQAQQYPLPPSSQFVNQSQIQSSNNQQQLSRQGSQQRNQIGTYIQQQNPQPYQQYQQQNENIYFKQTKQTDQEQSNTPQLSKQLKTQSSSDLNLIQNKQQDMIQNQINAQKQNDSSQQQSSNNLSYLKKSLSSYKFENLGELKQIYKEVQKRTAAMFQKQKEEQKNAQSTAIVSNSSIQDIQYQKSNTQRQKNNYYAKAKLQTHKKGSLTQRGFQNSQDSSQSKEISPRIHRLQKSEQSHLQSNSLLKLNSDREQNSRRVSSQIKSSSNFNNSNSQIQSFAGSSQGQKQQQQFQQSQVNIGGNFNIGASQLLMAAQQIQQNLREQALTTTQKKLQYKQQASKNGSEVNSRMINSNPNLEFNKTSYISSYNNSVNHTNIFAPQNYNQSNQLTAAAAQSAYSSVVNNFVSNQQVIGSNNNQPQHNAQSQNNSSKKILDKIKHTRINSMNVVSLQQSQHNTQYNNQYNLKQNPQLQQLFHKINHGGQKIAQQINQNTFAIFNSQSSLRDSKISAIKKNYEQYFTYTNNNITNMFVDKHQKNRNTIQVNNLINNHLLNFQQTINSMINTYTNLNKIIAQNAQSQAKQSQNIPPKKQIRKQYKNHNLITTAI